MSHLIVHRMMQVFSILGPRVKRIRSEVRTLKRIRNDEVDNACVWNPIEYALYVGRPQRFRIVFALDSELFVTCKLDIDSIAIFHPRQISDVEFMMQKCWPFLIRWCEKRHHQFLNRETRKYDGGGQGTREARARKAVRQKRRQTSSHQARSRD